MRCRIICLARVAMFMRMSDRHGRGNVTVKGLCDGKFKCRFRCHAMFWMGLRNIGKNGWRFGQNTLIGNQRWHAAFNCYIASTVHVAHAHKHRGARWADDASAHAHMRAKVHQNMTDCAAVIETHYLQGPWVLGNRYSMCDPYLALVTRWLGDDGVDVGQFPKIAAHNQAMRERPSMQTILRLHA